MWKTKTKIKRQKIMSDNEELTRLRWENEYLKNEVVKLSRYKLRHILCGMRDRCYRKSKEKKFKIRCLISNANTNEARNH